MVGHYQKNLIVFCLKMKKTISPAAAVVRERLFGRESWGAKMLRKMSIRGRSVMVAILLVLVLEYE